MTELFYASFVALWLLVVVIAVLVALLYRHFGLMVLGTLEGVQRDGLSVGAVAPAFSAVTADGQDARWEPTRGRPQLLIFATPDCAPCAEILPHVNRLAAAVGHDLGITTVVPGPQEDAEQLAGRYRPPYRVLAEDGSGVFGRYKVRVTPFVFLVGGDGRILAKGLANDVSRLRRLLDVAGLEDEAEALAASPPPEAIHVLRHDVVAANGTGNDPVRDNVREWSAR